MLKAFRHIFNSVLQSDITINIFTEEDRILYIIMAVIIILAVKLLSTYINKQSNYSAFELDSWWNS